MKTTRREFCSAVPVVFAGALTAMHFSNGASAQDDFTQQDQPDLADVAKPVAAEAAGAIGSRIQERFGSNPNAKPFRIAMFQFADQDGKVTLETHDVAFKAQGAFTHALGQALGSSHKGQFVLLDKFALTRELRDGGIDPASVSAENTDLPATLARVGIDVAILGSTKYEDGMTIQPKLVFASASGGSGSVIITRPSLGASEPDGGSRTSLYTSRLGLQIWRKSGNTFEPVPIVTGNEQSEFSSVLFALIPPGSEGTEFLLRISNQGSRAAGILGLVNRDGELESKRLFGVALTIDGVNSMYEDVGDGIPKPAIVHPRIARKWVLGPPGYQIVPAGNPSGYDLARTNGAGHSIIDVLGYQVDGKYARAFTFAPASQSLAAEKVGISDEIGVITAYYFAEKLPGDARQYGIPAGQMKLGTAAGRQVLQPVFKINPKFHKEPVHVIKIFYRSPDECPIPRREQIAISGR